MGPVRTSGGPPSGLGHTWRRPPLVRDLRSGDNLVADRNPPRERNTAPNRASRTAPWPLAPDVISALLARGLPAAARIAGVSPRTLRRRFAAAGTSIRCYVHQERRRRVTLLLVADVSVGRVATLLGFSCRESLARFMRREFGCSASEARERFRAAPFSDAAAGWVEP